MSKRSPRLLFTDEELAAPELKKVIKKADKRMAKLEKAEPKIPQKKVKTRVVDAKTGKVTTRISFEDKKKPPSKLTHAVRDAPINTLSAQFHREMRESEQDNVGVESVHKTEKAAETGVRLVQSAHRSHQLKPYRAADRAEVKADKANIRALEKEVKQQNPQGTTNPYSKWQQKQAIKKEYAAAKGSRKTVKASDTAAKAAKSAADKTKKAGEFIAKNKKVFLIIGGIGAVIAIVLCIVSSCSVMFQGVSAGVGLTSYQSSDEAITGTEAAYSAKEASLQNELNNYAALHLGYDEYRYDLGTIGHDPYVLTSILSAIYVEYTADEASGTLDMLFDKQYRLTETVTTEIRYRTESRTGYYQAHDPNTGEYYLVPYTYTVQVPYTYTICNVTLTVNALENVAEAVLTDEQYSQYEVYMLTQGNRPDIFGG